MSTNVMGCQWSRKITNIFCIPILVTKVDLSPQPFKDGGLTFVEFPRKGFSFAPNMKYLAKMFTCTV
jgi:hypothetical protein